MISTSDPRLDTGLRERLSEIADAIFPATRSMPSASAVGLSTRSIDGALRVAPHLVGPFVQAAASLTPGDPDAALRALRDGDPGAFRTLMLVIVSAYYMAPEVRAAIGYDGQQALRIDAFDLPGYLEDGSLDRVIARHPFYRDVIPAGGRS